LQEVGGDDEKDAVWTVPGWAGVVDPTTGQEYFYNSETGETSWEKPTELATKGLGAGPPPPPPPMLPAPPAPFEATGDDDQRRINAMLQGEVQALQLRVEQQQLRADQQAAHAQQQAAELAELRALLRQRLP